MNEQNKKETIQQQRNYVFICLHYTDYMRAYMISTSVNGIDEEQKKRVFFLVFVTDVCYYCNVLYNCDFMVFCCYFHCLFMKSSSSAKSVPN